MGPVVFEEGAAVAGDVMAAAAAFPKLRLEGEALLSRKEELLEICRWMREWLHTEGVCLMRHSMCVCVCPCVYVCVHVHV